MNYDWSSDVCSSDLLSILKSEAEGIGFRILHFFFKVVRFSGLDASLNNIQFSSVTQS